MPNNRTNVSYSPMVDAMMKNLNRGDDANNNMLEIICFPQENDMLNVDVEKLRLIAYLQNNRREAKQGNAMQYVVDGASRKYAKIK